MLLPCNENILIVGTYCPPCKVAKLRLRDEDVKIINMKDTEYSVTAVPTFIIVRNNKEVARLVGLKSLEEYKKIMSKYPKGDCNDCE